MNSREWGIFNDEASEYTEDQAVEAGFWSREEAEAAVKERYSDEDELTVMPIQEPEDDDDLETDDPDGEDNEEYPIPY